MQVKAHARFVRMSPRKVRLVIDLIRGARATSAQTQLRFVNKAAAEPVRKLLDSAMANAINNFQLNKEDLKIVSIVANEGPTLDRWTPKAQGRATPIRKRTSHLSIVLESAATESVPQTAKAKKLSKKSVTPKTE